MNKSDPLTPESIRAIRKYLGLSQEEAGNLLGGGARAFTKYETGNLKPSVPMTNLLKILEANPDCLSILKKRSKTPETRDLSSPFDVTYAEVMTLNPQQMTGLLRRLLTAEAVKFNLPMDGILVPRNIYAPDGGEDGRITWENDPKRTQFLPFRRCQFQLKTGKISPGQAAKELQTPKGKIKPMIRSFLEGGGFYIMLCTQGYNQKLIKKRHGAICATLKKSGLENVDGRIRFWGAENIAEWINSLPSVAIWVREEVGLGSLGGFSTWKHWSRRSEHSVPWVDDARLSMFYHRLQEVVTKPRRVLRVVGLSGVGKSRLCLETLGKIGNGETAVRPHTDFVMYTAQSEVDVNIIFPVVEKLVDSGMRAIVVVDDCDPHTHVKLDKLVSRDDSELSLVTIDSEIPERINSDTIKIKEAPENVIESIVEDVAKPMSSVDQDRLTRLSQGFPEVAIRIAREFSRKQHLDDPIDGSLIDRYLCGRSSANCDLLLQTAQLLSVFGTVRIESEQGEFFRSDVSLSSGDHLERIADLSRKLTRDDLYAGIKLLNNRGVVKRRGRLVTLEPRPIAVRLAERQWMEWDPKKWDHVLAGNIGCDLSIPASKRLAELNTTQTAREVVNHVCRKNGSLGRIDSIERRGRTEVLSNLAETDPNIVAQRIGQIMDRLEDLRHIREDVRSYLIQALRKIAFHSETFKIGARLLFQLEVAQQPSFLTSDSCHFAKLFSPVLGGTEADGKARLSFIDEIISDAEKTNDHGQLILVIDALDEGNTMMGRYSRMVGPEVQGSRRELKSWLPTSKQEWSVYRMGCVVHLGQLAVRSDDVGVKARSTLGGSICSLIHDDLLNVVKKVIAQVIGAGHSWTVALRQLKVILARDHEKIDDTTLNEIKSLVNTLEPTSLQERVRLLVTEYPMPGVRNEEWSIEETLERHRTIANSLADELLDDLSTLKDILPDLSRGRQHIADFLGESLATGKQPPTLLESIVQAVISVPALERNYDLLVGFVGGLPTEFRDKVEEFKVFAITSPELASAVPRICRRIHLMSGDIDLALGALNQGTLVPWDLHTWAFTSVLKSVPVSKVKLLLDAMLDHSAPSYMVAVIILGRILSDIDDDSEKTSTRSNTFSLSDFRSQLLKMIKNAGRWGCMDFSLPLKVKQSGIQLDTIEYFFEKTVLRMLSKGREDPDACTVALELAQTLVNGEHIDLLYPATVKSSTVLDRMLTGFPDIVWQIVGGAIVKNPQFSNRMKHYLGQPYILNRDFIPPILKVPKEILLAWCFANPKVAPVFLVQCVPFLSKESEGANGRSLNPIMSQLLHEFGQRNDVLRALESHIHPYHWIGSKAGHYANLAKVFQHLETHGSSALQRWAEKMRREVVEYYRVEKIKDAEKEALRLE